MTDGAPSYSTRATEKKGGCGRWVELTDIRSVINAVTSIIIKKSVINYVTSIIINMFNKKTIIGNFKIDLDSNYSILLKMLQDFRVLN